MIPATGQPAPVLADLARKSPSGDPKTDALLRRQAVWALAALGDNLQRFAALPEQRRADVLRELERATDTAPGDQAAWGLEDTRGRLIAYAAMKSRAGEDSQATLDVQEAAAADAGAA